MLLLLGLCLVHAWKNGGMPAVWRLAAGVLFGWLLEWATIKQLQFYEYGPFLLKMYGVPLAIGMGWGVIIYSGRLFADATDLPVWARPVLCALLGLNIDLSMDAVAIRLGMWKWGIGLEEQFFGVPCGNFWAWFWVILSFSAGLRLLVRDNWFGRWLAPIGAILIGTLGVLGTNALIEYISAISRTAYFLTVSLTIIGSLVLILALRPKRLSQPNSLVFWVPLGFHVYFLAAGFLSGVILNPPFLLIPSAAMFITALYLHRSFYLRNA